MAEVKIAQIDCCKCGMIFWVADEHLQKLLKCHNTFYCPNGHAQFFAGETDRDKLEKTKRTLELERKYSNTLVRSNAALRGVITKMKKRQ